MEKRKSEDIYGSRYLLKHLLGQGSTAQVYLAEDIYTGEIFAAKVSSDYSMLEQEEKILQSLGQKVFPEVKNFFVQKFEGKQNGFLIMEYMEGGTLQRAIDKQGYFLVSEAVRIVEGVLECVKILHQQPEPLIYRDIKPENIMFDRDGKVRLIDAASVILGKYRVGTYGYAAPEQFWEGVKLKPCCDLYAVGKVLAYLLTGKNPGEPPYDMLEYCRRDRKVPSSVFSILERSLAKEEMGRYSSADEFLYELNAAWRDCQHERWWKERQKQQIIYEKCIHRSGMQRIF